MAAPLGTLGSVATLLAETIYIYQGNHAMIGTTSCEYRTKREILILHMQMLVECCYIKSKVNNGKIEVISFVAKLRY
jgi:hypothetical protein